MYRVGTAHFQTTAHAKRAGYTDKDISEDVVSIGPPATLKGEKLLLDSNGRYFIEGDWNVEHKS